MKVLIKKSGLSEKLLLLEKTAKHLLLNTQKKSVHHEPNFEMLKQRFSVIGIEKSGEESHKRKSKFENPECFLEKSINKEIFKNTKNKNSNLKTKMTVLQNLIANYSFETAPIPFQFNKCKHFSICQKFKQTNTMKLNAFKATEKNEFKNIESKNQTKIPEETPKIRKRVTIAENCDTQNEKSKSKKVQKGFNKEKLPPIFSKLNLKL